MHNFLGKPTLTISRGDLRERYQRQPVCLWWGEQGRLLSAKLACKPQKLGDQKRKLE